MKKKNGAIDITKFIMALFVIAIHVRPFEGNLNFYFVDCITRIADPLFFTISAFFLFDKIERSKQEHCLRSYMLRVGKMYFLWIIILIPLIIRQCYTMACGERRWLWLVVQGILFTGPYGAMWFLTALLLAIPLTYLFFIKLACPKIGLLVSFLLYFFNVLESEYTVFVQDIDWLNKINEALLKVFAWHANGLTYGFFFCALGAYIAQKKNNVGVLEKNSKYVAGATISWVLLIIEVNTIRYYGLGTSYGNMLSLAPLTYFSMICLLKTNIQYKPIYNTLRKMSTLMFLTHFFIMEFMNYVFRENALYMSSSTIQYIVVVVVTCILDLSILKMSQYKQLSWLKNLY